MEDDHGLASQRIQKRGAAGITRPWLLSSEIDRSLALIQLRYDSYKHHIALIAAVHTIS